MPWLEVVPSEGRFAAPERDASARLVQILLSSLTAKSLAKCLTCIVVDGGFPRRCVTVFNKIVG